MKNKINYLSAFIMVMPFLWGLFYEFLVFICACLLCIGIANSVQKNKKFIYYKTYTNTAFLLFTIGYWISMFFAVDKGVAFSGVLKFTVPWIFLLFLMQLEKEKREECIKTIPTIAVIMLILSVVASLGEGTRVYFFQARRLGGFFQYSNTMALFFLIGIVLLAFEEKKNQKIWTKMMLLTFGILLTGSRTVFFMMILLFLFMYLREKTIRKKIMGLLGVVFVISSLYVCITGDYQNIGRYLSSSLESSTLLGRMLYNLDGIKLLGSHLGGVGYKGYYILQPLIQTGVYTAMFVHNDWLQIALDAGIITAVAFAVSVIGNIVSKDTSLRNKIVLVAISFHMLLDFDLQYFSIFAVMLFMFPLEKGRKEYNISKVKFLILTVCILYGYFAVSYFCCHLGAYEIADKMYPYDSQIKEVCMLSSSTIEEAESKANEVLAMNPYSYAAWNIKAVAELEKGNYTEMIQYKKQGLAITKYDILEYQDYIVLLKKAIDGTQGAEQERFINDLLCVEGQMMAVLEKTHKLAYRIKDKPELELGQEYKEYIGFYREN